MAKKKFYVVWTGRKTGVFDSWKECEQMVSGYEGARFKSFPTLGEAEDALIAGPQAKEEIPIIRLEKLPEHKRPNTNSISVDAACSGNPGDMEYRGVFTDTGTELFRSKVYKMGTNNIGEFLAIVHCLAWQQKKKLVLPIYTDSKTAISWVKAGQTRTKLLPSSKNTELFILIERAEVWLKNNKIHVPLIKWDTENWGEIPADFGRK
ncbi:MAG: ribonuclease H family protein [Bacteroidetes bacterium]|jgi:ribonuclease HI|nr:ribonuclease H family protein [Bacteroidota bacterium]